MRTAIAAVLVHASLGAGVQDERDPVVDWRSRARPGLDVLVEFEAEYVSEFRGGGGTAFELRGEFRDRTFAGEADAALGVRTVRRRNGSSTRNDVRFYRVAADGSVGDEPPLRALRFERSFPELPYSDPLGARVSELAVGPAREREVQLRDPGFVERFRAPLSVRESVTRVADSDPERRTVVRSWHAADERGLASPATGNVLRALEDRCVFTVASGTLLERRLRHSSNDAELPERGETCTLALVEVGFDATGWFLEDLEREGRLLFEAYCASRPAPEAALARLDEWSALPRRRLGDVAAEIWLLALDGRDELAELVREARERSGAGWDELALSAEDLRLAVEAGRVTALVARVVVDNGARHRDAWARRARERRGEAAGSALLALHDVASRAMVDELREVELGPRRMAEAAALLAERLDALR